MFGKKAETEVVEEVEHELKFKEWFNLKGIRAEIKNIHWLKSYIYCIISHNKCM